MVGGGGAAGQRDLYAEVRRCVFPSMVGQPKWKRLRVWPAPFWDVGGGGASGQRVMNFLK